MVNLALDSLPDLHSQSPSVELPVALVGHRGVKRLLIVNEYQGPVMLVLDVAVGLTPLQRGAHMSRLIDCIPQGITTPSVRDYLQECFGYLRKMVPEASRWCISGRATAVLPVPDGFKPIEEIARLTQERAQEQVMRWGTSYKVCLACPQAQAAIAHDCDDDANVGRHPSHNQVCDLELTVTYDSHMPSAPTARELLDLGEGMVSGKVRERYKRRGEADCVTDVHKNAMFAEDSLRGLASALRRLCPDAISVSTEIINYESIFEYPLYCTVTA
jgi:GTP cyclohydrolase FolE2